MHLTVSVTRAVYRGTCLASPRSWHVALPNEESPCHNCAVEGLLFAYLSLGDWLQFYFAMHDRIGIGSDSRKWQGNAVVVRGYSAADAGGQC